MKVYGAEIEAQREIDKSTIVMKDVTFVSLFGSSSRGNIRKAHGGL